MYRCSRKRRNQRWETPLVSSTSRSDPMCRRRQLPSLTPACLCSLRPCAGTSPLPDLASLAIAGPRVSHARPRWARRWTSPSSYFACQPRIAHETSLARRGTSSTPDLAHRPCVAHKASPGPGLGLRLMGRSLAMASVPASLAPSCPKGRGLMSSGAAARRRRRCCWLASVLLDFLL